MFRNILFTILLLAIQPAFAASVVFINPGHADEAYWQAASRSMQEAAKSLDMQLEVLYAERDHTRALTLIRTIVARPAAGQPDYLIITNDYGTAPEMLRLISPTGIPTLLAFSGIHGEDRVASGAPRSKFPFWLGSIEPDAKHAGVLTVNALIDKARKAPGAFGTDGKLHVIAIAGDRSTPSSTARTEGMMHAVKNAPDVVLEQVVYGDWKRDKAAEQASWLYARYPQARLVWAGSDQMAFGAMDAWRKRGGKPGIDAFFSGINTSPEAMTAMLSGELGALAGGHFMCGAWAMVMLHDHAKGRDFRDEGLELRFPMFILFDPSRIERFRNMMLTGLPASQFRAYSKARNPHRKKYDFNLEDLLH